MTEPTTPRSDARGSDRRARGPAHEPDVAKEIYSFAQIQHLVRVEFSRAQRYAYPLVVLEIAVDRLGHLRDVFGYELKEDVLGRVLALLIGATRGSDLIGRLPDDRLLVLVPHVQPDGAATLAERLLSAARGLELRHDGRAFEVTLSIGGSWTVAGETLFFDDLLGCAATALDEAAASGGDRYVGRPPGHTLAP